MANVPTVGVFIPNGYLNIGSSPNASGQSDAYGNVYPSGLNPGKVIELGPNGAQAVAAPGTTLYDGAYQWVQLDSGATASLATEGNAAFIRLDSGATQGTPVMSDYVIPVVTTADRANTLAAGSLALFAGIFLNPATYDGNDNAPTPGEWCFIFVGGGRASVSYGATVTSQFAQVVPDAATGNFKTQATAVSLAQSGISLTTPVANTIGVAYYSNLIYRIPNL